MRKRYKEFLIDILTKTYQIVLAIVIITPVVTREYNKLQVVFGIGIVVLLIVWAGSISAKMEGS